MNGESNKKKYGLAFRLKVNLPVVLLYVVLMLVYPKLHWTFFLYALAMNTIFIQTMITIGPNQEKPTLERFLKRLPVYVSHVFLPFTILWLFIEDTSIRQQIVGYSLFIPVFYEIAPYAIVTITRLTGKNRVLLRKIAVPIVLITFFAFYGLAVVGKPQISLYIAFLVPFMSYAYLIFRDCMHKHSDCLKTLPECLLKVLVLMVVPWLVLSSQTEFTYEVRLLIGLEFFAIGLINHTICPRIIGRIGKKHDSSS
ncbi:MAG TPA: hypothetical protein PKD05_11765 [Candidatus Melainabacteria bacterium]|nr:hypothetical protein [Candidatus Melainabacteria bacterium]HMP52219.1 hypothetical protein [Candidatus Melainabacteria bacterium]